MKITFLTKRRYMNKDLVEDRYGRYFQIPKILSEMGNEVTIICLDYHSLYYEKPRLIKDGRLTIMLHTTGKRARLVGLLRFIRSVKRYLEEHRPDALIGGSDALQSIIAAHLSGPVNSRLILDLYDNYEAYTLTQLPFIKWLFNMAVKKADAIAVISPELEEYIKRSNPKGRVRVIGNAVEAGFNPGMDKTESRKTLQLPLRGAFVGTAGDLSRKRGVDVLIRAFNLLASESRDIYLILAGKGRNEYHLSGRARL